jgi:hypothetical protein
VYHTAVRRVERRLGDLEGLDEIPQLDASEAAEFQRDIVLRVDAELLAAKMSIVRAISTLESDPTTALDSLADIEEKLPLQLRELSDRLQAALDQALPGRHRVGARRNARQLQLMVTNTVTELRNLRTELSAHNNAQLLLTTSNGELELRSFEPNPLDPAETQASEIDTDNPEHEA